MDEGVVLKFLNFLRTGAKTSPELQERLGISQASLSRLVQKHKKQGEIVVLGAARSTRYALLQPLEGVGGAIPVYEILENGDIRSKGALYLLAQDQYAWEEPDGKKTALLENLPYWIQNMRPEGFMGRSFVHNYSEFLGLPKNLQDWSERHVLRALSLLGDDVPGNIIAGKKAVERYLESAQNQYALSKLISREDRGTAFMELAQAAIAGEPAESSAGGEQPKFISIIHGEDGNPSRVIVKFAQTKTNEGRRWSDLLVGEHIAGRVMRQSGIQTAEIEIIQHEDWTFLQSTRFDRVGLWGRKPLVSMAVVDAEFVGAMADWGTTAQALFKEGMMNEKDCQIIKWLTAFGTFIGNTDMHLGNLSLIPESSAGPFRLAPAYDMTAMYYRPKPGGVLSLEPITPKAINISADIRDSARKAAEKFWGQVLVDKRISEEFRKVCEPNLEKLKNRQDGPRVIL